jgi:hypothetical protein
MRRGLAECLSGVSSQTASVSVTRRNGRAVDEWCLWMQSFIRTTGKQARICGTPVVAACAEPCRLYLLVSGISRRNGPFPDSSPAKTVAAAVQGSAIGDDELAVWSDCTPRCRLGLNDSVLWRSWRWCWRAGAADAIAQHDCRPVRTKAHDMYAAEHSPGAGCELRGLFR